MTPKEKALELFNKYATYVVMWKGDINTTHQNCKQCALIAVDEIIKSTPQSPSKPLIIMPHFMAFQYWQEVKKEIEKL